jgi:predicted SAM-dependent methyltransferase
MINEKKLNLACGQIRIKDYFGIDMVKMDSVDAVMNLEDFPWDIASDSAEDIICNHYTEHTPMDTLGRKLLKLIYQCDNYDELKQKTMNIDLNAPNDGLISFMEEVYRILKVGGKIHIVCPHYNTGVAWQDPTHRRAITEQTFHYFNKGWRERSNLSHYGIACNFDAHFRGYELYPDVEKKSVDEKLFSSRHLSNFIANVKFDLIKNPTNHEGN